MLKRIYALYDRMGNFYDDRFIVSNNEEKADELAKRDFILLIERYSTSLALRSFAKDLELSLIGDFNTSNGYLKSYDEKVIVMTGSQALAYLEKINEIDAVKQVSILDYEGNE